MKFFLLFLAAFIALDAATFRRNPISEDELAILMSEGKRVELARKARSPYPNQEHEGNYEGGYPGDNGQFGFGNQVFGGNGGFPGFG